MDNITEKMIEQAKKAETLEGVEDVFNTMDDDMCIKFLERLIEDVNAMNHHSNGNYIMLQAVLMYAKKIVEKTNNKTGADQDDNGRAYRENTASNI